jgi:hypothetical protein
MVNIELGLWVTSQPMLEWRWSLYDYYRAWLASDTTFYFSIFALEPVERRDELDGEYMPNASNDTVVTSK